jgi:TATA-binding protein-associated factor Taf7
MRCANTHDDRDGAKEGAKEGDKEGNKDDAEEDDEADNKDDDEENNEADGKDDNDDEDGEHDKKVPGYTESIQEVFSMVARNQLNYSSSSSCGTGFVHRS